MRGNWEVGSRYPANDMADAIYDRIGVGYARYRRPDERIAARIGEALGTARSVLNVGAGTGSYEPADRDLIAVEPSAEALPLRDGVVDAAMAILTIHHWGDWRRGIEEMVRVSRDRVVILTWDPECGGFWLISEYFPEIASLDREIFPTLAEIRDCLGSVDVRPVPVPHDCTDGFLGAYWRRPEKYLDPGVRQAMSSFAYIPDAVDRLQQLRRDLQSGAWHDGHRDVLERTELDLGYRLVIGEVGSGA